MKCIKCKSRTSTHSGIIKGVYYSQLCDICLINGQSESSGTASYNRQRDLEDHLGDMVQPYAGGLPNPDFIRLYPQRASQLFSPNQIEQAIRH